MLSTKPRARNHDSCLTRLTTDADLDLTRIRLQSNSASRTARLMLLVLAETCFQFSDLHRTLEISMMQNCICLCAKSRRLKRPTARGHDIKQTSANVAAAELSTEFNHHDAGDRYTSDLSVNMSRVFHLLLDF